VSIGLATNIEQYNLPLENDLILNKIKGLYAEDTYNQTSGSGSNAKTRIPKLVPFAKTYFSK